MRQQIILLAAGFYFFSCTPDDPKAGFSPEELSPAISFTRNDKVIKISHTNSGLWTSQIAMDNDGNEIADKVARGFGSVIDSSGNGKYQVTIIISKWVTDSDVDFILPNVFIKVIKPEPFKSTFYPGKRQFAIQGDPIVTNNEVMIEYFDEAATRWTSSFSGNASRPSYTDLQPSSSFIITRSMPFGTDSVFVEIKFKCRMYKNATEFFEIKDGYFKGYYYRY